MPQPPKKRRGVNAAKAAVAPVWLSDRQQDVDLYNLVQKSVQFTRTIDEERDYLKTRAPNALEWITRAEYCNQATLFRHWGAYRLVKEFFELRCPVCNHPDVAGAHAVPSDSWGLSRDVLESEVLLVWTPRYEDDACPKCGTTRAEFVERGLFHNYRVLNGIIGQRSGKSSTLGLIGTYMEHVALTIHLTHENGIHGYLGIPAGDLLHMTFVASTDTQSKETIWAKYRGYRALSPWFRRYVPWVKAQEKIQETPEGMQRWEYNEVDKSIKN